MASDETLTDTPRPHWTQTPEGRAKMAKITRNRYKTNKHWTQTPKGRKRIAKIAKMGGEAAHAANPNGLGPYLTRLLRDELTALARRGAEARLSELEAEVTKLRIFLGKTVE
jgi:hypothetical protein